MTNPVCPKTGASMHRGVRSLTLTYKGESITFDMPGWYCDQSDEGIHTGAAMKISGQRERWFPSNYITDSLHPSADIKFWMVSNFGEAPGLNAL